MKISIETVFKSENCGSFLQAWALKRKLEQLGNEVYFSDYQKLYNTFLTKFNLVLKCCFKGRVKRALNIIEKTNSFNKIIECFQTVSQFDDSVNIHIFGSDTIWNIEDKLFLGYSDFFTGKNVKKPCYAYSASVGSTNLETFLTNRSFCEEISKFKSIALRDKHSEDIISKIYPKEKIVRTIDPTLLIDSDEYIKNFVTKRITNEKYLLLYFFGNLTNDMLSEIKRFATKKNLKIVYVGLHEKIYDVSVVATPKNFITAFCNAEYIFTNTFHGCVFSTIFNKKFITNGVNKKKVSDFLEQFSLTDRIIENTEDFEKLMTAEIDYEKVNSIINDERSKSIAYLEEIIKREENYEQ